MRIARERSQLVKMKSKDKILLLVYVVLLVGVIAQPQAGLRHRRLQERKEHSHVPIHFRQHASPTIDRIRQDDPRAMEAEPFGPGYDFSCVCRDAGGRFGLGRPG
jgi:hypothetical protein